jgi:hypothetical protein
MDDQNIGSLFGAMSDRTAPAHCMFLPHVMQLGVAFPCRTAPAAGDASVPLSRARASGVRNNSTLMIRRRCLANEIQGRGDVAASVSLVACRCSPKCLIGVKREQGYLSIGMYLDRMRDRTFSRFVQ